MHSHRGLEWRQRVPEQNLSACKSRILSELLSGPCHTASMVSVVVVAKVIFSPIAFFKCSNDSFRYQDDIFRTVTGRWRMRRRHFEGVQTEAF